MENIQSTQSGKTCLAHSAVMAEKISAASSKNSLKSQPMYQSLDLRTENGIMPEKSWETISVLHGESWTHSIGESPSLMRVEEWSNAVRPNVVKESILSQILEANVPEKYYLSAKAAQGILNRAKKRGKELPTMLREALEEVVKLPPPCKIESDHIYALQGNGIDRKPENGCAGKGYRLNSMYTLDVVDRHGVAFELSDAHAANIEAAGFMGDQGAKTGGIGYSENIAPTLKTTLSGSNTVSDIVYENDAHDAKCLNPWDCQSKRQYAIDGVYRTLDAGQSCGGQAHGVVYPIDALSNNSMKSSNPYSGFHETDCAKCLDTAGCNPSCNQSGNVCVFDTTQITSPQNGCNPKIGSPSHPLAAQQHPPLAVIELENSTPPRIVECITQEGFFTFERDVSPPLKARDWKDPNVICFEV